MTLRDVGSWLVEIIEDVKLDVAMIRDASIIDWPLYILILVVIVALFALVAAINMATDFARKHYDFTVHSSSSERRQQTKQAAKLHIG